jgi:hypothetical protein
VSTKRRPNHDEDFEDREDPQDQEDLDLEERPETYAHLAVQPPPPPEKEGLVQRIGLTGLIGAVAALITVLVALISAFNSRTGHAPDAPPAAAAPAVSGFNLSDYWSGVPANTNQPLIFHLMVSEHQTLSEPPVGPAAKEKAPAIVLGTLRNPCQSSQVLRINSGSWDGNHLTVEVKQTGSGKPLTLNVTRNGDLLDGSVLQGGYDGKITLHRGETNCPAH